MSWISPVNNVVVTATIQTVSRFSSRGPAHVEGTKRAALRLQLIAGGLLALLFLVAARGIAFFEHDPSLTLGLELAAGIVFAYSLYAVFVGACNGAREFHRQAGLDATFTALKAILVCGAALVFSSVIAAVSGFVIAALSVLCDCFPGRGSRPLGQDDVPGSVRTLLGFMAPVALYLLISNLLMFVDGWVVKRLVARVPRAPTPSDPARLASEAAAVYTAVQAIARIPYQAILAVTFVIFPLVSRSTFQANLDETRGYIDRSLRLSFLAVMAAAAAVAARPDGLLNLFPKGQYLGGANALAILALGYVAYSLLTIAGTILNGAGRTRAAMYIGFVTLILDAGLIRRGPLGARQRARPAFLGGGRNHLRHGPRPRVGAGLFPARLPRIAQAGDGRLGGGGDGAGHCCRAHLVALRAAARASGGSGRHGAGGWRLRGWSFGHSGISIGELRRRFR